MQVESVVWEICVAFEYGYSMDKAGKMGFFSI
jgi:hypothetical protein